MNHDEILKDTAGNPVIVRYKPNERTNHWITAITFVLLAVSGLALFHPATSWMAVFLGGGQWTRILHPFIGLVMFASFLILVIRFWHHNFLDKSDRQWLRQMPDVLANREEKLPRIGKYNAGQKLLFWVLIVSMVGLLLTGIVMWRAWFSHLFAIDVIRIASLLHAFFAFVIIVSIILHVYAAIWVKGSMGAMIRGTVTYGWARKHHHKWFEDEVRKSNR